LRVAAFYIALKTHPFAPNFWHFADVSIIVAADNKIRNEIS
jgi:hypothetical protein